MISNYIERKFKPPSLGREGDWDRLFYGLLVKEQLGDAVVSSVVRGDVYVGCCIRSWASRSLTGVNRTLRVR
jgi:hypothetical protein